jgi:hypothetical protein
MGILKFVAHSRNVLTVAVAKGWLPAARYTNLRDVRHFHRLGFLDIDWRRYDFERHLDVAAAYRPVITVARDVDDLGRLDLILSQASSLARFCDHVVIVPKDPRMGPTLEDLIPGGFALGYSVPTRYGGTTLPPEAFRRPVHLLGGRPDIQRKLANLMQVISIDRNRFTLDAAYGHYFDGSVFRPHPSGGYHACLEAW